MFKYNIKKTHKIFKLTRNVHFHFNFKVGSGPGPKKGYVLTKMQQQLGVSKTSFQNSSEGKLGGEFAQNLLLGKVIGFESLFRDVLKSLRARRESSSRKGKSSNFTRVYGTVQSSVNSSNINK